MRLKLREEAPCGAVSLEITSTWMAFKTKRVGEVTKRLRRDREEETHHIQLGAQDLQGMPSSSSQASNRATYGSLCSDDL